MCSKQLLSPKVLKMNIVSKQDDIPINMVEIFGEGSVANFSLTL